MSSLPASIKEEFKSKWVVSKTCNKFLSIPIDQIHEQENAKVKGKGGVIGLTENPTALRRWMIVVLSWPDVFQSLSVLLEVMKITHSCFLTTKKGLPHS